MACALPSLDQLRIRGLKAGPYGQRPIGAYAPQRDLRQS